MKLIKNDLYLLLIDEEAKIKIGDIIYLESGETPLTKQGSIAKCEFEGSGDLLCTWRKVIAYYPLTSEAKKLGLPILPKPFEEKPLMEQAIKLRKERGYSEDSHYSFCGGFIEGYKLAQSKQFSLEDMKKAIQMAREADSIDGTVDLHIVLNYPNADNSDLRIKWTEEEIIQSLSTQQLPVSFEPEYINTNSFGSETNGYDSGNFILKTTVNSGGKKVLCGTYKY